MAVTDDDIQQAAEGNLHAFRRIYDSESTFVYSVAMRMLRHDADACEVTQDVFMNVFHHLKTFRGASRLRTWLYRVTVNTTLNKCRSRNREHKRHVTFDDVVVDVASPLRADETVQQHDAEQRITALLAELNDDQRLCVVLREIEGLSYEDIARTLGVPVGTVRSRLKRARQTMLETALRERRTV